MLFKSKKEHGKERKKRKEDRAHSQTANVTHFFRYYTQLKENEYNDRILSFFFLNMASILFVSFAISCQFFPLLFGCHCQSIEARFRRKFESKQTIFLMTTQIFVLFFLLLSLSNNNDWKEMKRKTQLIDHRSPVRKKPLPASKKAKISASIVSFFHSVSLGKAVTIDFDWRLPSASLVLISPAEHYRVESYCR